MPVAFRRPADAAGRFRRLLLAEPPATGGRRSIEKNQGGYDEATGLDDVHGRLLGRRADRARPSPKRGRGRLGRAARLAAPPQHPPHPGRRAALPKRVPGRRARCGRVSRALHAAHAPLVGARRQVRPALHRRHRLHARPRHADQRPLLAAELASPDHQEHARHPGVGGTRPEPGLPDLRQAPARGRLPHALYREVARLDPARGGGPTRGLRLSGPHPPRPHGLEPAGHGRRRGQRLSQRPVRGRPGRGLARRPPPGRAALVPHGLVREPARQGVLLGRDRVPDL